MLDLARGLALGLYLDYRSRVGGKDRRSRRVVVDFVGPRIGILSQKRSFHLSYRPGIQTFFVCILFCIYFFLFNFFSEFCQTGQLSFMTQADSF